MPSREAPASNEQLGVPNADEPTQHHHVQETIDRLTGARPHPPQADEVRKK